MSRIGGYTMKKVALLCAGLSCSLFFCPYTKVVAVATSNELGEDKLASDLLSAVNDNDVKTARNLLEKGADMSKVGKYGNTLLHIAVQNCSPKMVKLLLTHETTENKLNGDAKNDDELTPLGLLVAALARTRSGEGSPHQKRKMLYTLKTLIKYGKYYVKTSIAMQDKQGNNPIHALVNSNLSKTAIAALKLLVNVDPNNLFLKNQKGKTPFNEIRETIKYSGGLKDEIYKERLLYVKGFLASALEATGSWQRDNEYRNLIGWYKEKEATRAQKKDKTKVSESDAVAQKEKKTVEAKKNDIINKNGLTRDNSVIMHQ